MAEQVLARVIIEMLGAPQDYIANTMKTYVDKIKKEHTVQKTEIAEAEPKDKLFTIYSELEIRFKDLPALLDFCFESMPSSVEVLEPNKFSISLDKLNSFLNDLQARLHEADAIIKNERTRQQVVDMNSMNVFRRFLLYLIENGKPTASEMSHHVGVHPSKLVPYLDKLVEENKLKKDGDKYAIPA